MNFFAIPAGAPAAVDVALPARLTPSDLSALRRIHIELPPLTRVPGSVAGRTYHVKFWVSIEGRVTRVDVDPPIADAAYGREFQQRMMAYQFYPARTRDGRNVSYVVMVPLRIGN